jgi:hypothetical protein
MTYDIFYYRDLAMTKREAEFDRDIDRDRLARKLKSIVLAHEVAHCVPKVPGSPVLWYYHGRLHRVPPTEATVPPK